MCGIIGAWLAKTNISNEDFNTAVDSLYHRGPDERGVFIENQFYLGMRRLSIIDLKSGSQPIYNEDKTKVVLFNGEIYNYKELIQQLTLRGHCFRTESDTEVIVHTLEEGFDKISNLRGMFAITHYDRVKGELSLIRDRVGVKPLYYLYKPEQYFLYSSELKGIKALADILNIKLRINPDAIYHYLSFSNIPQPVTIYEDVKALMPGHVLRFNGKSVNISRYWNYNYYPKFQGTFEEAKEQCRYLIKESVALRLRSDVPLGLFLSGGVDSSVVAYEAAKLVGSGLQTFTVGFPSDPRFDESSVASATANSLGINNTILPLDYDPLSTFFNVIDAYDQPFADPSAIPSLRISELAGEHVKVVINGDGGDEQFAGYRRYGLARYLAALPDLSILEKILRYMPSERRSAFGFLKRMLKISGLNSEDQYLALTTDVLLDGEKDGAWIKDKIAKKTADIIRLEQNYKLSSLDRLMHLDRCFNLLSGLLVKMDIATSAYSLEARSPFLDNKLFEFSSSLPDKYKYNGRVSKHILREIYKDKLSKEVISGGKRGFEIPLVKWLKQDFKDIRMSIINNNNSRIYDYLESDFVRKSLQFGSFQEKNQGYLVYSLLLLSYWLDKHT